MPFVAVIHKPSFQLSRFELAWPFNKGAVMTTRQQRRAEERARAKRGKRGGGHGGGGHGGGGYDGGEHGGISIDEAIARMTGVGGGNTTVTINDLPDDIREMYREKILEMEAAGMGPITLVKKRDGSYSMFTAPTFEGLDGLR